MKQEDRYRYLHKHANEVVFGQARVIWSEGVGLQPDGWWAPGRERPITDKFEALDVAILMDRLMKANTKTAHVTAPVPGCVITRGPALETWP